MAATAPSCGATRPARAARWPPPPPAARRSCRVPPAAPTARPRPRPRPCPARNSAEAQRAPAAPGPRRPPPARRRHSGASSRAASATPASASAMPAAASGPGRSPVATPTATGSAAPKRRDGRHHRHRADGQAAVERRQARTPAAPARAASASVAARRRAVGPRTAVATASSISATLCDTASTASRLSVRLLSPPIKSAEPPGDAGGQPERYCDHLTLQPTGSVSAGSGSRPSSTASSASRSQRAPAAGSS